MAAFYLIAIGVGLFMIAVAVFNWDFWFFDSESRVIEMIGGEMAVRWYWGIGGLLLIISTATHWIWGWDF
ncbi:MAG: hypothetical protein EXR98_11010 [Gemmataceae bacterium]|nr:hypothetical protein [Gemmataceae bacterium]